MFTKLIINLNIKHYNENETKKENLKKFKKFAAKNFFAEWCFNHKGLRELWKDTRPAIVVNSSTPLRP